MAPFEMEKVMIEHLYKVPRKGFIPKNLDFVPIRMSKDLFWRTSLTRRLQVNPMRSNILAEQVDLKTNFRMLELRDKTPVFGYKDYLEKIDVEWVEQGLPHWLAECASFKQDFAANFNEYKKTYFGGTDVNVSVEGISPDWGFAKNRSGKSEAGGCANHPLTRRIHIVRQTIRRLSRGRSEQSGGQCVLPLPRLSQSERGVSLTTRSMDSPFLSFFFRISYKDCCRVPCTSDSLSKLKDSGQIFPIHFS